jgi:hypothetical protein
MANVVHRHAERSRHDWVSTVRLRVNEGQVDRNRRALVPNVKLFAELDCERRELRLAVTQRGPAPPRFAVLQNLQLRQYGEILLVLDPGKLSRFTTRVPLSHLQLNTPRTLFKFAGTRADELCICRTLRKRGCIMAYLVLSQC